MEPTPQISKALEIIENVQNTVWKDVWVNKNQCKRVADRFKAIGELLRIYRINCAGCTSSNSDDSTLDYSAFDELLTVLQKGQALVSTYVNRSGIKSVLTWSDNREAFKEIHEELETMKAKFPFDLSGDQFDIASWSQRDAMFTQDAKQDLEAMKSLPDQSLPPEAVMALEKVAREPTDSRLPSYLRIDMSEITIKAPGRNSVILRSRAEDDKMAMVFEGSWRGCDLAVKVFASKQAEWNKDQMVKEVGALMEFRHPHIVQFVGFAQSTESCSLLKEMTPKMDLRHYMYEHARFTRSQELDIITQIANVMLYLHAQGYVHRELKCSNISVKQQEDSIEVKFGNFQYAQKLESDEGTSEIRRLRWLPPEVLENYGGVKPTGALLKQGDVYSFAMTCYEIVTGNYPFPAVLGIELTKMIKEGPRPELPVDLEQSGLKGLIESCWADDPKDRPTFELICIRLDTIRSSMPAVTSRASGNAPSHPMHAMHTTTQLTTQWYTCNSTMGSEESEGDTTETTTLKSTWKYVTGLEGSGGDAHGGTRIPENLRINPETLKKVRIVGRGGSASVYEATWSRCRVAVKRVKIEPWQELNFLIQLRHPYIIQLYGFTIDSEGHCSIVMEYMEGNLRNLIDSRKQKSSSAWRTSDESVTVMLPFEFDEVVCIILKLAQGMAFLHSKGVVHRDLKARNVMCQEYAGNFDVRIVDFGVSQFVADAGEARSAPLGTGFWRAPELFDKGAQCGTVNLRAADVYSFAMTCYEIITGNEPRAGARPELPGDLEQSGLKGLIESCWAKDPNDRPVFKEICICLETIRSSIPTVANKSSKDANVWNGEWFVSSLEQFVNAIPRRLG